MEHLYIVLHKYSTEERWNADLVLNSMELARGYVAARQSIRPNDKWVVVEGTIITPETDEEADKRMGEF
jgi:hypothetical protein